MFKTGINAQVYLLVGPGENLYMLFKRYTRSAQTVLVIYKLAITDIPADMLIKKYYHSFFFIIFKIKTTLGILRSSVILPPL